MLGCAVAGAPRLIAVQANVNLEDGGGLAHERARALVRHEAVEGRHIQAAERAAAARTLLACQRRLALALQPRRRNLGFGV